VVEWHVNQHFENHLCPSHQATDYFQNLSLCHNIPAHYSWWREKGVNGQSQVAVLFGLALMFINMLVIGDQTWLSIKPLSLFKFFSGVFQLLPLQCRTDILMFCFGATENAKSPLVLAKS
jgi:hypothetical protein